MTLREYCLLGLLAGCGPQAKTTDGVGGHGGAGIALPSAGGSGGCVAATDSGGVAASDSDPLCQQGGRATLSFARDVAPNVGCTGEVCHQPWAYDTLVAQHSHVCCDERPIVEPFHPSRSHLVETLLGTSPCVGRMPPSGQLPAQTITDVIAWICQGAPNN